MAKYFSDDQGRYISIDDLTKGIYIGRLSSKSYGVSGDLNYIFDLLDSIITSKSAEHYYSYYTGCCEVILGSLHISIGTTVIHINETLDKFLTPSDLDKTMNYYNKFLKYFNE